MLNELLDQQKAIQIKTDFVMFLTIGWIGWGLSPNGGMTGADVVIGWKDDTGVSHIHDRYARGRFKPQIDVQQDYTLLQMTETTTNTSMTFKRKLKTADENDIDITDATMRVIWSWSDQDPMSKDDVRMHTKRGSKSILLLDYGAINAQPLPSQYKTFDLRVENKTIDPERTMYWCKAFKIPDMGEKKQHVVQIDPLITPGNEGKVCRFIGNEY